MNHLFNSIFIILTFILFLAVDNSARCSCSYYGEISVLDYNHHDLIFKGEIMSIESGILDLYKFLVLKAYKNCSEGDTLELFSCHHSNPFIGRASEEWLVFSHYYSKPYKQGYFPLIGKFNNKYITTECQRNSIAGTERYEKESKLLDQILTKLDGKNTYYYPDSTVSAAGRMINGSPEGEWTYYCENNDIRICGSYENSMKEGLWSERFDSYIYSKRVNGQVLIDEFYISVKKLKN